MLKIDIYAKDIKLTQDLKDYVDRRLQPLEKLSFETFAISAELAKTTLHHKKGFVFRAEFQVEAPGKRILRAEAVQEDLRAAIDEAKAELERELKKAKKKDFDQDKKKGRFLKALLNISSLARFRKK